MMSCFRAKLVFAVVAVYLLLGVFRATSSLLPNGGDREKCTLSNADCGDGLRKTFIGRKRGSFGCQSDIVSKKVVPVRSLRIIYRSSPPSPIRNPTNSQGGSPPLNM